MTESRESQLRRDELPIDGSATPFIEAVVLQLSRAEQAGAAATRTDDLARRLMAVLHAVERGAELEAVSLLESEPLLVSSVFQNADLLYRHEYPGADALSMATLTAIHRAAEARDRTADDD